MFGDQVESPEAILPFTVVHTGKSVGFPGIGIGPMFRLVLVQVSVAGGPALAPGGVVFCATTTVSMVIQPVAVFVMLKI